MKHHKHIYGQKPLVHQLDELRMVREGLSARPKLITQNGQSARLQGRPHASRGDPAPQPAWPAGGGLGVDGQRGARDLFLWSRGANTRWPFPVPESLNWDLWHGPLKTRLPYSEDLAPRRWRAILGDGRRPARGLGLPSARCPLFRLRPSIARSRAHSHDPPFRHGPLRSQPEHPDLCRRGEVRPREVCPALQ